jgi:hypothetical protein
MTSPEVIRTLPITFLAVRCQVSTATLRDDLGAPGRAKAGDYEAICFVCEKIKYEIANLLVMVLISLRSFSSNPTAEDQTKVIASSSYRFIFVVHSECQLNYHDVLALKSEPGAHRWSNLPHQTTYKNYRGTPPQRPTALTWSWHFTCHMHSA